MQRDFPITSRVLKVFNRNFMVFRKTWTANIMFNFIEPMLYLSAMGLGLGGLVGEINGLPYIQYLAPGLVASSAMWAAAFECTYDSFVRMSIQRTYHAIMATPITVEEVVVGEMLYGIFKSVLYGSVILLVLLALGLVASPLALLAPLVLVAGGLIIAELGMLWTSLAPRIDSFNYFFTLIISPMFLFAGIFFPLAGMPGWVAKLAWGTPLFHMVKLIRALVLGRMEAGLWISAVWLLVVGSLLFYPPIYLMRRRLVH